jgi:hypothetical protein
MRIDSFSPRVPCSCDGGPAAPQRFAEVREAVRAQRPDRVTLSGGAPPAPIVAAPNAAAGEPTDPEAAGPAGSPGPLAARYGAMLATDVARPRLEVYA